MVVLREVVWGDALVALQFRHAGGLQAAVDVIRAEVGPQIGVRATFQNLLRVEDPAALSERERFRAWCLLATFGQDPARWGIPDTVVPRAHDPERLGAALSRGDALYEPDADDLQAMRGWEATADPRELTRDFSAEDDLDRGLDWPARQASLESGDADTCRYSRRSTLAVLAAA